MLFSSFLQVEFLVDIWLLDVICGCDFPQGSIRNSKKALRNLLKYKISYLSFDWNEFHNQKH